MKKLFTLIELIVVIVILGILAAIVIPNISSWQKEASNTAITSNVRNIQTSIDMYVLDNQGKLPIEGVTEFEPQAIPFDKLNPEQLRNLPKTEGVKYWVDAWGKVWGSYVDAPKIKNTKGGTLEWEKVEGAKGYHVYEIKGYKGSNNLITSSLKTTSLLQVDEINHVMERATFQTSKVEVGKAYVVSAVDQYGFETAPSGEGYKGYDSISDKGALYVEYFKDETYKGQDTTASWLSGSLQNTTSEVLLEDIDNSLKMYNSIISDGNGGFIAVGYQGYNKHYGRLFRLNSNFEVIEQKSWGTNYTGFILEDIIRDNDGNYVIVGKELDNYIEGTGELSPDNAYIIKLDSNLNHIASLMVGGRSRYYDNRLHHIIQNTEGNYIVSGEKGGNYCQDLWIIEFSKNLTILNENSETSLCSNNLMEVPIVQDNDGNYVIVRESNYKGILQKLDSNLKWIATKTDESTRRLEGIIKNSKGNLVVSGYSSKNELYIAEYDSNFNKLDFNVLPQSGSSYYKSIIQNKDGGYVAIGSTNSADLTQFGGNPAKGYLDILISVYDNDLNFLTLYNTGSSGQDTAKSVVQDTNGDYILIGTTGGDLRGIGGNDHLNRPYNDGVIIRYKAKEGFNISNNILQSKSIDLKEAKPTVKIDVDMTLPEGTSYKLYMSTDNSNWRQVPLEYINSGKEFGLGSSAQYIYWKTELQGTSVSTPTVNKIKIH